jgi:hypothetical protein
VLRAGRHDAAGPPSGSRDAAAEVDLEPVSHSAAPCSTPSTVRDASRNRGAKVSRITVLDPEQVRGAVGPGSPKAVTWHDAVCWGWRWPAQLDNPAGPG